MKKTGLTSQWGIWFAYLSEAEEKEAGYSNRLNRVHTLDTVQDLIYIWQNSPIASLTNFFIFVTPTGNRSISYNIEDEWQKINAINIFKRDIEPKWEHPQNSKGGRLVFQVDKDQQNYQDIYEALFFYLIGEKFQASENINGFRFISAKASTYNNFLFRVEIWVNFDNEQTEKLTVFRDSFSQFIQEFQITNLKISFKNNR